MRTPRERRLAGATLLTASLAWAACALAAPPDSEMARMAARDLGCPAGTVLDGGDGALRSTYGCTRPGTPPTEFHGPYGQWYRDGRPALRGQFGDDGRQTGEWTFWHPDGDLASKGRFVAGRQQGQWTFWHPDGVVARKGRFVDGQPDGEWTTTDPAGVSAVQRFDRGVPVTPAPEVPEVTRPADISCAAIAERLRALAVRDMGAGLPQAEDRAAREALEQAFGWRFRLTCGLELGAEQRTCLMVVPKFSDIRSCDDAPGRCRAAFGRMQTLADAAELPPELRAAFAGQRSDMELECLGWGAAGVPITDCMGRATALEAAFECLGL